MKNMTTTHNRKPKIYLVNPKNPDNFWAMQSSVDAVGVKTLMPNAALATLIALTPPDIEIEYIYCDENVSELDPEVECDLVAVTGYTLHSSRIREISRIFKSRNIPVALGGIFATIHPDRAREYADFLFTGEAEYTWPQFLEEWLSGRADRLYQQADHIKMTDSPPPVWSHIKAKDYLYFSVQTSRGCPNNCDFCDAVRLVGRKYRAKSIEQIMIEIENAFEVGAETVFFSEDNFFVNESFTQKLLTEIIRWNTAQKTPLSFAAQATIKIGDNEEIVKMLADARFSVIFLGIESINKACLDEINKGHIFKYNPKTVVSRLSEYGILPFIGFIVGFDNDDKSTFDELEQFMNETASPITSLSILNAPENTALYDRMKSQGRLNDNFGGTWHFSTNITPISMTMEELISHHRKLFIKLYEPTHFEKRVVEWLSNIKYLTQLYPDSSMKFSKFIKFFYILKFYLLYEPLSVKLLFFRILFKTWKINPRLFKKAITIMSQYCHYYDFANNMKVE